MGRIAPDLRYIERRSNRGKRALAGAIRSIRKGPVCEKHRGVKLITDATTDSYVCPVCIGLQSGESEGQAERNQEFKRATGGRKRRLPPKSVN